MVADLLRIVSAVLAAALVPTCVYCMFAGIPWDQRVRFGALILYGTLIVGWQLELLGSPPSWRMPLVLAGTALALAGAVMFLVRHRTAGPEGHSDGG